MSNSAILAAVFPQLSNVIVEGVVVRDGVVVITARGGLRQGHCPECGQVSWHVHGSYRRRLADLPVGGRTVRILLWVPRFVCTTPQCPRRTFSEQVEGLTRRYRRVRPST